MGMNREFVKSELARMNAEADSIERIREKDGVIVARVQDGVFKGFVNPDFRREIDAYRILQSLNVPTLRVLAHTDASLLLEDVNKSAVWRLGVEADMDDERVARVLAAWYRTLHAAGYAYVAQHGASLYDENDVITRENLAYVREKTGTQDWPAWALIDRCWDGIMQKIRCARRTLTYNDFYYTNLIVAHDGRAAMMFDYNLLGKGYAYADVRNVCLALSARAGAAFKEVYGAIDAQEAALDEVAGILSALHFACARDVFPSWGKQALDELRVEMPRRIERLLET